MFEMQVKDDGLTAGLTRLIGGLKMPRPLMRAIAGTLETETERNFASQGRPQWLGLAPATIKQRKKAGTWPGKILQVSAAGLAASVSTDYGNDFARIGSNKPYAAIQHLGGDAGRGRKVKIPARHWLPADGNGNLQPAASASIQQDMRDYLANLAKP